MVDILLSILGAVLIIIGIIGCVLPILPGPPISWTGLLVLHFTKYANYTSDFLVIMAIIAIAVTALDYIVPILGTKKFGGSKAGVWGSTIGLILGLFFFPPIGIILGPFIGAFIAESIKGKDTGNSLKAALGSLLGFLIGVGFKLITSFIMTYYFLKDLFT